MTFVNAARIAERLNGIKSRVSLGPTSLLRVGWGRRCPFDTPCKRRTPLESQKRHNGIKSRVSLGVYLLGEGAWPSDTPVQTLLPCVTRFYRRLGRPDVLQC